MSCERERLDVYCRILISNIVDFQSNVANYRRKDDPDIFNSEQLFIKNLDYLLSEVVFTLENSPWTDFYDDYDVIKFESNISKRRFFHSIKMFFVKILS